MHTTVITKFFSPLSIVNNPLDSPTLNLSPLTKNIHPHIEIEKQQQHNSVENRVEHPRANPIAPTFEEEMQQKNPNMARHVTTQQHNLAVQHKRKARATKPNRSPEPVAIHERVHERGEENRQHLKRLRVLEPEEGDEGGD